MITNPGVACDEAYLPSRLGRDLRFRQLPGLQTIRTPRDTQGFDPSRFAAMPYNISDVEAMRTAVKDAIIKRIGYLYISDANRQTSGASCRKRILHLHTHPP